MWMYISISAFFLPENADEFPFEEYDYVVDAVDTVTAKIELVMKCQEKGVPIMSSMGAGNKLDASQFKVADIYKTKVCPLAKVMRRELKKRRVRKLKVVYSEELPKRPIEDMSISCRTNCICPPGAVHKCTERRDIPGSVAYVPSVAGLIIAGEVVKDLITVKNRNKAEINQRVIRKERPHMEEMITREQMEKLKKLQDYLRSLESVAVAFSSGVDSTFLLKVAKDTLGDKVMAVTAQSCSFPKRELKEAIAFCEKRESNM